jgi:hypothetical protein
MTPALLVQLLEHHYRQQAISQVSFFILISNKKIDPTNIE